MPEAQTGKSKGGAAKTLTPKYAPKRFDPAEHGGVKQRGWLFLFCGVILPVAAMIFETTFHFCARHFFDPFPSPGHVVLFGLIPLSNFLVWLGTRRDLSNHYAFMSLVSGMAMGVACLYTLMFLPLTPMACLFSLALGFGLLGLAPLLSLPCNWISGRTVCQLAARKITFFNAHQVEHLGHMIILVMVIAIELPSTLTRINLSRAADPDISVSTSGVGWLRHFGSQEVLLRACYERSGRATDILGSLYESAHPLNVDVARRVFFQVTGKPFNSVPIPRSARATIQHTGVVSDPNSPNAGVEDEFDVDTDIAGEAVSGVARGLSVSQSKFDGKIDADAALASLNWSFAFTNDSKFDREARAKILLPPQAVVTRATLTINNVERDATIMVRSAARARYRMAVAEHKDPLLVSTCGLDQVLVQCFPVRPGETVKVKLQLAAPMQIDQDQNATLVLPAFLERNFQVDVSNDVDIQSNRSLTAAFPTVASVNNADSNKQASGSDANNYRISGKLDAAHLAGFSGIIVADRDKSCTELWCKTDKVPSGALISRHLTRPGYSNIKNVLIVIDASAGMQQFWPQIVQGLQTLPASVAMRVKVVGDAVIDVCPTFLHRGDLDFAGDLEKLKKIKAEGGEDDFAALNDALLTASAAEGTSVLWIHGAQPVTTGSSAFIKADLTRVSDRPLLFDMQLVASPNQILDGLDVNSSFVRVPREGAVPADLSALLASFGGTKAGPAPAPVVGSTASSAVQFTSAPLAEYFIAPLPVGASTEGREVDGQLAKIWANRQISLDMQTPRAGMRREARALADAFQIVSAVSSAIVTQPVNEEGNKSPVLAELRPRMLPNMFNAGKALRSSLAGVERKIISGLDSVSVASSNQATLKESGAVARYSRLSPSSSASVASGPDLSLDWKKQKEIAPELQGATNGTIAPQGEEMLEKALAPGSMPQPAAPPAASLSTDLPEIPQKTAKAEKANEVDDESVAADRDKADVLAQINTAGTVEAKPVPEADTWLLLMVIAVMLLGFWIVSRRRADRA